MTKLEQISAVLDQVYSLSLNPMSAINAIAIIVDSEEVPS